GTVFDRNGKILATSSFSYRAAIDLNQYNSSGWGALCKILGLDPDICLSTYVSKQIHSVGPTSVIPIKDQLTWREIAGVELLSSQIPGIMVIPRIIRIYPYGSDCCHCVGYVTRPSQNDVENNANLKVLDASIGKMGIERYFDARLQGEIGIKQVEVNAARRMVRLIDEKRPAKGSDVSLTIDIELQKEVARIMQDVRCGAILVLNIRTGDILASVSVPSFDPNTFSKAVTSKDWNELTNNADLPLINRAVSGVYAPGSVFKPIVALAALNNGIILKQTRFCCPGYYEINRNRFHCHSWRFGGHGSMDVIRSLEKSCDVFFYNVAVKLGLTPIINTAKDFGFGARTNVELPEEKRGQIPSTSMPLQKQYVGQTINLSIGQGQLTATPLQLAVMTARLASGKCITPHIVINASSDESSQPTPAKLPYSNDALEIVRAGMAAVVKSGPGMRAQTNALSIAGKTGSTQVCRITKEERQHGRAIERPYHLKDHAIFIAYAPVDDPRIAVVVVVEHGESGGRAAAPLGGKALAAALPD
ncbi:MAG: penicillin-binding protein 2, partial [Holosporales bacterium]|nr:penicillin-binding protein 2 [Holosporales bacterium]